MDAVTSLALVLFGGWIVFAAWRELRRHGLGHRQGGPLGHSHSHDGHSHNGHGGDIHDHHHDDHRHDDDEAASDPLYAPLGGGVAVLSRHAHRHRHGDAIHVHWHDHASETAHALVPDTEAAPPEHAHWHRTSARTALLLILGSSPMVEGIPAFFAASRYGIALVAIMAVVFAASTIATHVALCVYSAAGLRRLSLGPLERFGEVMSGALIALLGLVFWLWPVA